ncbi:steroid delta-isomerase [Flavobacteriaceae bacterium AU392]|nr:steroid delta-isomerase [Flavobacteriaceae bacterium]RKM83591.1 steroid delta-isomerase [Flavobacteriaceae bacterium AU392]
MKRFNLTSILLFFFLLLTSTFSFAQPNTDVFLFDLNENNGIISISNKVNISSNEGYDNQPSFLDNNTILFASTRNGQTDILKYSILNGNKSWVNTSDGSEYSPLKIPNSNAVTAIQLDKDGTQTLNRYSLKNGKESVLIDDIVIGYQVWYNKSTLISSVLDGEGLSLTISNIKTGEHETIQPKIGRSLHNIPGTDLVSYVSKTNDKWEIRSLNPKTKETKLIVNTVEGADDMCWTPNGTILMGKGDIIYKFNPKQDSKWVEVVSIKGFDIKNISRLAVNTKSNKLSLVAENGKSETPEELVQRQVEAYNSRDLEAFMSTYSDDVKIYFFPEKVRFENKDKMRERFISYFKNTPDLHCEIKNRITISNKVIDEEYILANGKYRSAVAVYEIENGLIQKVTFIY